MWEEPHEIHDDWTIHIRDQRELRSKINSIKNEGPQNLMVISDFDQTISKYWYPDTMESERARRLNLEPKKQKRADAAMRVMFSSLKMNEEIKQRTIDAFNKYRPIEMDQKLTLQEKAEFMREWWESNLRDFSSMRLNDRDFHQMVYDSRIVMRHGLIEKINLIQKHGVPMYVLSGGIKEIIEASLIHAIEVVHRNLDNLECGDCLFTQFGVRVLSNTFEY